VIADLIDRYRKLVYLAADPKVFPTPDVYVELAREWFGIHDPSRDQVNFVMQKLKVEIDRQSLFQSMNEKFGPSH
jgi:hypothetical protein